MTSNGRHGDVHIGEDDVAVEEEDPKDSVAVNCIRFTVALPAASTSQQLDVDRLAFAPVYTHQCFPGEYIPGYHPLTTPLSTVKHSSLQHAAMHRLAIDIALAPACDHCTVSLQMRPLKRSLEQDEKDVTTQSDNDNLTAAGKDTNDSNHRCLSETEIYAQLQRFLPPIVSKESSFSYLSKPVGSVVAEYSLASPAMDFCLTVCLGKECADYHKAVQKLATWYIESASDIDSAEEGGAWKILYLFRKHNKRADNNDNKQKLYYYSLVGYMTLFHFESPLRKPVGGTIVRVCQALLLPCYQRMGHGKRMLHTVFDQCRRSFESGSIHKIVEVNVEDPAPAFAELRNVVDWERYHESGQTWFREACHDVTKSDFFAVLKDSEALPITVQALTTTRQIQTVYELDRLQRLQQHLRDMNSARDSNSIDQELRESLEKRFRLMVKQRLNRQNGEEIASQCGVDKMAAKLLLEDMFQAVYRRYIAILKRHGAQCYG